MLRGVDDKPVDSESWFVSARFAPRLEHEYPRPDLAFLNTNNNNSSYELEADVHLPLPPTQTDSSQLSQSGVIRNDTISSNNPLTSEMGYTVSDSSNPWITRESTGKMDDTVESNTTDSERKDLEGERDMSVVESPSMAPIPAELTPYNDATVAAGRQILSTFGTPSTVSTVPSSDDVSVDFLVDPPTFERLSWKIDDVPGATSATFPRSTLPMQRTAVHRRSQSWEDEHGMHPTVASHPSPNGQSQWNHQWYPVSSPVAQQTQQTQQAQQARQGDPWNGTGQARVASFRTNQHTIDSSSGQYNYQQLSHTTDAWRQQRRVVEAQQYYMHHQMPNLPPSGQYHHTTRKAVPGSPTTPPRNRQNTRPGQLRLSGPAQSATSAGAGTANTPRSASEVLKTLLRKKACLYEPDTSRAVALVSWLVGRELALEYGYFSRQQLQSGVHACVAAKIEAGTITRTKVNRCMQIILNSCFHYIIPRSDGSEENGDAFRQHFAESAQDDHSLLASLLPPWNEVTVDRDVVIHASLALVEESGKKGGANVSPPHSPRLSGADAAAHDMEGDDHHSKRSVLLCFNENVRSAEDAFRCHNEFIRDAANVSRLQLTAKEWLAFFGDDAGSPSVWSSSDFHRGDKVGSGDVLGQMDGKELAVFRTTWCAKRYDHDHDLCGFAHVEINGGWLRRNPRVHQYRAELCPNMVSIRDSQTGLTKLTINQCPNGDKCPMAHSSEELIYHASSYKKNICKISGHAQGCCLGDVCPNLHPHDSKHTIKGHGNDFQSSHQRHSAVRHHHNAHGHGATGGRTTNKVPPSGAPTLYVSPAPLSAFEKQLQMPGLQNLFRRHSAVLFAKLKVPSQTCRYSNFGDDNGIVEEGRESTNQTSP